MVMHTGFPYPGLDGGELLWHFELQARAPLHRRTAAALRSLLPALLPPARRTLSRLSHSLGGGGKLSPRTQPSHPILSPSKPSSPLPLQTPPNPLNTLINPPQLFKTQLQLEEMTLALAARRDELCRKRPCVVFYDRGLMDMKAYITPELWGRLLAAYSLTEGQVLERYDLVIHLARSPPLWRGCLGV